MQIPTADDEAAFRQMNKSTTSPSSLGPRTKSTGKTGRDSQGHGARGDTGARGPRVGGGGRGARDEDGFKDLKNFVPESKEDTKMQDVTSREGSEVKKKKIVVVKRKRAGVKMKAGGATKSKSKSKSTQK